MAIGRALHWPLAEILDLEHHHRGRVLAEIERYDMSWAATPSTR